MSWDPSWSAGSDCVVMWVCHRHICKVVAKRGSYDKCHIKASQERQCSELLLVSWLISKDEKLTVFSLVSKEKGACGIYKKNLSWKSRGNPFSFHT